MKIKLITPEKHAKLLSIYSNFPALTLQNKGYEGINKDALTDEAKQAIKEVEAILKKSICGFSRFQNFRINKDGKIEIRLQYNYGAEDNTMQFIGVGYILIDELLNGFKN